MQSKKIRECTIDMFDVRPQMNNGVEGRSVRGKKENNLHLSSNKERSLIYATKWNKQVFTLSFS